MIYSVPFLAFVLALLVIYYICPRRFRWFILLAGSMAFYWYNSKLYCVFIVWTIIFTYVVALGLTKYNDYIKEVSADPEQKANPATLARIKNLTVGKKKLLVLAVCLICFGILVLFKLSPHLKTLQLVMPLGISYYTFQSVGYIVDVYRGKYRAEKNILKYATFVGYFPCMLQGPINRYDLIKAQFEEGKKFQLSTIRAGAGLFLWGLFKKLVIADRAAIYVKAVLLSGNIEEQSGSMLLLALILFMVQMYGDFSGGIDMVEGVSEMFGITMFDNFRQPFFSTSIGEYWRRWHVSLGKWIRDYVFFPLCLSKPFMAMQKFIKKRNKHLGKTVPSLFASIITFIIIGLWHEISMKYLLYGIWFGATIGLEEMFEPVGKWFTRVLHIKTECMSFRMIQRLKTYIIVIVGESFSILPSAASFFVTVKLIFTKFHYPDLLFGIFEQGLTRLDFFILFLSLSIWWWVSNIKEQGLRIRETLMKQNVWFRWILVVGIIWAIAIFGIYGPGFDASAFLYGEV